MSWVGIGFRTISTVNEVTMARKRREELEVVSAMLEARRKAERALLTPKRATRSAKGPISPSLRHKNRIRGSK